MSTRGCVAVWTGRHRWRGVYNHSDSYPTGLGKELWDYLHQDGVDLIKFGEELMHYGDWREYRNGGLCEYCGKVGVGQPHTISGDIYVAHHQDGQAFPDPDATKHQHGTEKARIRSEHEKQEGLFIEWVYVIDPKRRTLTVLTALRDFGEHTRKGNAGSFKSPNYRWEPLGTFSLDGEEPEWEYLEHLDEILGERAHELVEQHKGDSDA